MSLGRCVHNILPCHCHKKVVVALILSRLDYCNALYLGIHKGQLRRLQLVQNAAARLVMDLPKHHSVSSSFFRCIGLRWIAELCLKPSASPITHTMAWARWALRPYSNIMPPRGISGQQAKTSSRFLGLKGWDGVGELFLLLLLTCGILSLIIFRGNELT